MHEGSPTQTPHVLKPARGGEESSRAFLRFVKKAHLRRCRQAFSLRRTLSTPALRELISALHMNLFDESLDHTTRI